jgi:hypothetical protein
MAFVTVLSYSRQIFLRFFLNARMETRFNRHAGQVSIWYGIVAIAFPLLFARGQAGTLIRRCDMFTVGTLARRDRCIWKELFLWESSLDYRHQYR